MNIQSSYEYLKKYYNWRKTIDDYKLEVLIVLLQSTFGFEFNVSHKAYNIKDAILKVNTPERILKDEIIGRKYIYQAYKNQIDAETMMNTLKNIDICVKNGDEIIHHILAIMFLGNTNYNKEIGNILIKLIDNLKFSDVKTESIYFLFLIDPYSIKQQWIDEIIINQKIDGSLYCEYKDDEAYHTGLGLLLYMSYNKFKNKQVIKKYVGLMFILLIFSRGL